MCKRKMLLVYVRKVSKDVIIVKKTATKKYFSKFQLLNQLTDLVKFMRWVQTLTDWSPGV